MIGRSLACAGLVVLMAATQGGAQPAFDAAAWRAAKDLPGASSPRDAMVGELEREVLRPGAGREEVLALLGPPDRTEQGRLTYLLGAGGLGADLEGLVLDFDAAGKLTGTRRVRF